MHELSIASNIVEAVTAEMQRKGIGRVEAIALRIGRMTDVDADALTFGFEVITKDTPLDGTRLAIEHIPIQACCQNCHHEFEVPDFLFVCPQCQGSKVDLTHGTELDIAYLEIDEESDTAIGP